VVFRPLVFESSGVLLLNGRGISIVLHLKSLRQFPSGRSAKFQAWKPWRHPVDVPRPRKSRIPATFIAQSERKSPVSDYNDGGSGQRRTAILSFSDRRSIASALVPRIVVSG
jgi:hypothetical protein